MSELQTYYDAFRSGYWAAADPEACPCRGSGWALSEVDTWHECPVHYKGQTHPEDYDYFERFQEDEREIREEDREGEPAVAAEPEVVTYRMGTPVEPDEDDIPF